MNEEIEQKATEEVKEEFVPKKAYADVAQDMHKYKSKLKETEALLNQLQAEKELAEQQSLKDNEQWKTLYEQTNSKLESIASQRAQEREQFVNHHKKNAVIRELGGFKKDEYNSFINVNNVEMDEQGNIIPDSLSAEVNRLKQSYPELIKVREAVVLPSEAPKDMFAASKDYGSMSSKEKADLLRALIEKQNSKK